jgi:hypothetical protein
MTTPSDEQAQTFRRRHLRLGWWTLAAFIALGMVLDTLHGLKISWYLDASNPTPRFMWTLAHSHGTLVGLVNVAFASAVDGLPARMRAPASNVLIGASVLLPGGFLLGGMYTYAGDPGLGALIVPLGGLLLLAAVVLVAVGLSCR